MICEYVHCGTPIQEPAVIIQFYVLGQGSACGVYCSVQHASVDMVHVFNTIATGANLAEVNEPDAPQPPQPLLGENQEIPVYVQEYPDMTEQQPTFARDTATVAAHTTANPDVVQGLWQHVVDNTPQQPADAPAEAPTMTAEPTEAFDIDTHARNVGNEIVTLLTQNLGFHSQAGETGEDLGSVMIGRDGVYFDVRITTDHVVKIVFGENHPYNMALNTLDPNLNMGEVGPFILQRAGEAWQQIAADPQQFQANVGF